MAEKIIEFYYWIMFVMVYALVAVGSVKVAAWIVGVQP